MSASFGSRSLAAFVCVAICVGSAIASAQGVAGGYTGREAMVPMRDGVKLYTQIFQPADRSESYPILIRRTPYDVGPMPRSIDATDLGPSPLFSEAGYVFVRQDVRGQFRSEGEWEVLLPPRLDPADPSAVDETTDAFDTVAWLLDNVEGHNGRVGMWGISYSAWETVMAMADAHPALAAVSPQASPADMFVGDDIHHYGAFRLSYMFSWMSGMAAARGELDRSVVQSVRSREGYDYFLRAGPLRDLTASYFGGDVPAWDDLMAHGTYDEHWKRRNPLVLLDDVRPAVLHVAGWFDAEDFRGPIDIYHRVERADRDERNSLVVGPWIHGGWNLRSRGAPRSLGDLDFGSPTGEWFREHVELPFFEHHLRGADDPRLPEVLAFETGENAWREFDRWPPESIEMRPLYLWEDGIASFDAPGTDGGYSQFASDPADPVPYTAESLVRPGVEYMVEDQRFLRGRDDVLSFVTAPLQEDLVIAGRPEVRLHFTVSGTDADWIVKLIDVYPDDSEHVSPATGESLAGCQLLVTGEIFRAKFRDSLERPTALEPGQVTELEFVLPDRLHRFRAGHRLMVQVQSSWFPMYDRNPQTYTDIYSCGPEAFQPAQHRVIHREDAASRLSLPVLSR